MDYNTVCWFEIYVEEMDRAKAFYESVLGVELTRMDMPESADDVPQSEMWGFPMKEGPGAPGAICKTEGVSAGGNSTVVYFSCEDCGVEASRVEEAGGTLITPKTSIGEYGFIAIALDTEGNKIGLHSPG